MSISNAELVKQFEYPLPFLEVQKEKLYIETSGNTDGKIHIKNGGGGVLSGKILSNYRYLVIEDGNFSGNDVIIGYKLNLENYKQGELINSNLVIMSNGGEKVIPVIIKIIPPTIETAENYNISSLKEFANYVKKYPKQGAELFFSSKFEQWLILAKFKDMDIFKHLVTDTIKDRAVDNFLILCKLKTVATIDISDEEIVFNPLKNSREVLTKTFKIRKIGHGYINKEIFLNNGVKWLRLSKTILTNDDFENSVASIDLFFYPELMEGSVANEYLLIDDVKLKIVVKKQKLFRAYAVRECLLFDDNGEIIFENNFGEDVVVKASCKDSFIRFDGKKYFVGKISKIPFTVKMSRLQLTQLKLKKQPTINSSILLEIEYNGEIISKNIDIVVGEI